MTLSFRAATGILAGALLALASLPAMARFEVRMGVPGPSVPIGTPGFTHAQPFPSAPIGTPGFPHAQPPVYVTPSPYSVPPHRLYNDPRPIYIQPPPVYLQPHPAVPGLRHRHGNRFDRDRDGIPDYRERDTDRDGVPNFQDRRPFDRSLY